MQRRSIFFGIIVASLIFLGFLAIKNNNEKDQASLFKKLLLEKERLTKTPPKEVKIPILMYHYVEYNQNEEDFLRDQQNVPPNIFESQLITLKNAGYTFITPKNIPEILKKKIDPTKKYIIISFDDGFRDFYTDAYPILKKQNVPAINYIPFNFINGQDYMTMDMLKEIAKNPLIEIGSHTLNHAYLLDIPEQLAYNEIKLSKNYLEQTLGVKVESFAYPFGNYDKRAIELIKKAGYKTAVTVEMGGIVKEDELFTLKRVRPGHLGGSYLLNYLEQL